MSRLESWLLHTANFLVGSTGVLYAVFRYGVAPLDPYSPVHPAQPAIQNAHLWTAPLFIFVLGLIWKTHAWAASRGGLGRRRHSGLGLMLTAGPLILSGYFLQTAVHPAWRRAWILVHLTTAILWLAGYLAHQLAPRSAPSPSPLAANSHALSPRGGNHAPTQADL